MKHLWLLGLVACHDPYSNDDLLFLLSIPRNLELQVPEATNALSPAQENDTPARLYLDTLNTAKAINEGAFAVLDLVDAIAAFPPSLREADKRVWGPFPNNEGADLVLTIERINTSSVVRYTSSSTATLVNERYQYILVARPSGTNDTWLPLFAGEYAPIEAIDHGMGRLYLDLDAIRTLNPNEDGRGFIAVLYDTRFRQETIELYLDTRRTQPMGPQTAWVYQENEDKSGRFLFYSRDNVIETTPAQEIFAIAARWLADASGRADAAVFEGDADRIYYVSECWNPIFLRTYLASNIPGPDWPPFGQEAACGPQLQGSQFPR